MNRQNNDQKLQSQLRSLVTHYENTLDSLEHLKIVADDGSAIDVSNELMQVMTAIRTKEPEYHAVLELWNQTTPSDSTRNLREQAESKLRSLIQRITQLEESAESAKARLVPQLNSVAKSRAADQAYRMGESCR